jgi:hypothetical protein
VTLREVVVILGVVFVIALAVVVGSQMSAEALAVVVGIVCGAAAGIPGLVLALVVLSRRERLREEGVRRQSARDQAPPVVVIQGGTQQALPPAGQAGYWPAPQQGPPVSRQFHVVGGEDLVLDEGDY